MELCQILTSITFLSTHQASTSLAHILKSPKLINSLLSFHFVFFCIEKFELNLKTFKSRSSSSGAFDKVIL